MEVTVAVVYLDKTELACSACSVYVCFVVFSTGIVSLEIRPFLIAKDIIPVQNTTKQACTVPHNGQLQTQKLKTHLLGTQSSKVLPFKSTLGFTSTGQSPPFKQYIELNVHRNRKAYQGRNPFKPGAGLYIAMHATPTARNFFLANFYRAGPFTSIFSKTSLGFFLCWLCLTPVPVWVRRKLGHPAHFYRQLMQVPALSARGI